ncbi:DUF4339 domain-containing protein, partial [Nocardia sp. 852002-51101_SCH5132738]|uniref:DUF4339 domain-containing protein n=1 Tax=Nocardia sp. 852002-51101_SCH5132738 TaxID=1834095 RepID=UPI000AA9384D
MDQLRQFVAAGRLTPQTNVWTTGMSAWAAASTVPALQSLVGGAPPLPGIGGTGYEFGCGRGSFIGPPVRL